MNEEEKEGMTEEELKEYKKERNAGYNRAMRQRMKEKGDLINKGRKERRELEKGIKGIKPEVIKEKLKKAN